MMLTRPPPFSELLPGETLYLYLGLHDSVRVLQGCAQLVSHQWLAERCVPLIHQLQVDDHYQPAAAGWVLLRALPGATAQLQRVDAPARRPMGWVLQFFGFLPFNLKVSS